MSDNTFFVRLFNAILLVALGIWIAVGIMIWEMF